MQRPIPEGGGLIDASDALVARALRVETGQTHMMVLTIALALGGMTRDEVMQEIELATK